jgi:hypothetical protein
VFHHSEALPCLHLQCKTVCYYSEDVGSTLLRNVRNVQPDYMVLHTRTKSYSRRLQREGHITRGPSSGTDKNVLKASTEQ